MPITTIKSSSPLRVSRRQCLRFLFLRERLTGAERLVVLEWELDFDVRIRAVFFRPVDRERDVVLFLRLAMQLLASHHNRIYLSL